MANRKAFTVPINANGYGPDEVGVKVNSKLTFGDVHQVSPAWVLTFVRWSLRDTLRTKPTPTLNYQTTRDGDPLVVENDCVQCNIVVDKSTLTDSMQAVLKVTDVNYETLVAPGDFVIVNMVNWEAHARDIVLRAQARKAINHVNHGFKGIFKVQGVRKVIQTDTESGKKTSFVKITAYAFTEFNNVIYFNPNLVFDTELQDMVGWIRNLASDWASLQNSKSDTTNVQQMIEVLLNAFIGKGIGDDGKRNKDKEVKSPNTFFYIPKTLGSLLGNNHAKTAQDVYNFQLGIQKYSFTAPGNSLAIGLNPSNLQRNSGGRIWKPTNSSFFCQGETLVKPEYWNQVKTWSILNQFTNAPLNEMFSCFRLSPTGNVMPTIVFRQIPFTNDDFDSVLASNTSNTGTNLPTTRFTSLPRWKIDPALVLNLDIGRDESLRINWVQYYGRSTLGTEGYDISAETAAKNYLFDIDDIKRSGLRPMVINTTFDELTNNKPNYRSAQWAKIIGDAVIGQHLKMQGTMECAGIVAPISVGDNVEFDGIIYHLERVAHTCVIDPTSGVKSFRTVLTLSSGISVDSSPRGVRYAEMAYGDAYKMRDVDFQNNQIMPGISESQDVRYRPDNLDFPRSKGGQFKQPNDNASVNKTGEEHEFKEKDKK